MANNSSLFNISPYYDDHDPAKGFLRVLFKPGYALQARELTQLQTILQNQISAVGDHLFKDGSRIAGGGISVRNADFLMVKSNSGSAVLGLSDYTSLIGGVITESASNTEARIVHVVPPDTQRDGHVVLIVDYFSGTGFTNTTVNYANGTSTGTIELVSVADPVFTFAKAFPRGKCKLVTVNEGIFYVDGFFVQTPTQRFSPFNPLITIRDFNFSNFFSLNKKIGFSVLRDSVTDEEDSTLRDPSVGSYNYNAPGADRYKINLVLSQTDLSETPDDFVELLRFDGGKITKKVERVTYGEIERALARRTYDESGSYVVRPFEISVSNENEVESGSVSMSVGSGKAYVLGYEVENTYPQSLSLPSARTTQTESAVGLLANVGNYLPITVNGFTAELNTNAIALSNGSSTIRFRNAANAVVATAFSHGLVPVSPAGGASSLRYTTYFYGLSGNITLATKGHFYDNTAATGATIGAFGPVSGTNFSQPLGTESSSLVFPLLPGYAVENVSAVSFWTKMTSVPISATTSGTNTVYTVSKSNFSETISSGSSSVFSFDAYSNTNISSLSSALQPVFLNTTGNTMAQVWAPAVLNATMTTAADGNSVTITVPSSSVPGGYGSGAQPRVTIPVKYTPTISNVSTYRYKSSTTASNTFTGGGSRKTDESGRVYYELDKTDVYSVTSVLSGVVSYAGDFELDSGQRSTHYQRARLYLKRSSENKTQYASSSNTQFIVAFEYFLHSGLAAAPFIGKHSYVHSETGNIPYSEIPLYTDEKTGVSVSLANCLDFRRNGITSATPTLKPYGTSEMSSLPAYSTTTVSYSHYLPRIDKVCVKADPEDGSALFFSVTGTPDLSPVAPPDPDDALVLATVTVPAYTHNGSDLVITPVENRRYTMGEIGKIQKRLDDVEVFAKLSLSEADIESRSLRGSSADAEPLKTSIFSDEFYGHSIGDVVDGQYSCSVDYERGELRPFFSATAPIQTAPSLNGATTSPDGLVTIDYTLVPYIENKQYTKTVKINPSNTVNWIGHMSLSPSVDPVYDTAQRPVVKTNALMENDNWLSSNPSNSRGHGTQWNDWESIWTGIEVVEEESDPVLKRVLDVPHVFSESAIPSFNSGSINSGSARYIDSIGKKTSDFINARRLKNRIKQKIGSREIDRSVVPYIPSKTVTATVRGLKPNSSDLRILFDGNEGLTGISTDKYGSCSVSFNIPSGQHLAGNKLVRITDTAYTPDSSMGADAMYFCNGLLEQRDSGSYSVRLPEYRRQTSASETVSKDPFNRDTDVVEGTHWTDPLSQTFFVDRKTNPEGIYIKSVSLYFAQKDTGATAAVPVMVQIRPTVSGYPSPSVVVPFSTSVKTPDEITANASQPTETVFSFSSPVYLEPGEYAICVTANSDKYLLYAAQSSVNGLDNASAVAGRAGNNQLVGTLFTPQGLGPAVADNSTDLMFTVDRCDFDSVGYFTWDALSSGANSQIMKFYSPEIIPFDCSINRSINNSIDFANNESVYLKTAITSNPSLTYTLSRGVSRAVSPAVYLQAMYSAAIKIFSDSTTRESDYVSRIVQLPPGVLSNGISVFVDVNKLAGSTVKVYYRATINGESDIYSKPWTEIGRSSSDFNSSSEIDFRELVYSISSTTSSLFSAYQIKVSLGTSVSGAFTYYQTPAVKNIRAVSWVR